MDTRSYSIRYWPTWLGMFLLWCLSRLPWRWQTGIGRLLGNTFRLFASQRRHITEVNLALCFPELSETERRKLLTDNFVSLGIGIMEMAMSWWGSDRRLQKLVTIEGLPHLHDALKNNKGVILLSAHLTTLEIGGRLLALHAPFHVMYRKHKNPVIESVMRNARIRNFDKAIPRKDLRTMLKSLKDNMPVWYAPDQDYGPKQSLFAPFFGVQAASVTGTSRLARMSGAAVVPFFQTRLPNGKGYRLTLLPALDDFPGEDVESDTRRINEIIEAQIRTQPEQYLWAHRRFKTRPPGEKKPYKKRRKRRK